LPRPASPPAFPLRSRTEDEQFPLMKRAMDITGSLIALVLLSPLLLVIALTIKLTSKGLSFLGRRGSDNMANSLSFPPVSFLNRPRMNL
jgi:lipopolysaccharide/colanic/teichoic acid biosynthesis glycosyltransferase